MMPQCGFSNNVVQILNSLGIHFETFDVLEDMEIREAIKEYSNWPTIPQVYLKGEFVCQLPYLGQVKFHLINLEIK